MRFWVGTGKHGNDAGKQGQDSFREQQTKRETAKGADLCPEDLRTGLRPSVKESGLCRAEQKGKKENQHESRKKKGNRKP